MECQKEKREKWTREITEEIIVDNYPKLRRQTTDSRSSENTKQNRYQSIKQTAHTYVYHNETVENKRELLKVKEMHYIQLYAKIKDNSKPYLMSYTKAN